jgi:hypothetical protein
MGNEDNSLLVLVLAAPVSVVLWTATVGWIQLAVDVFVDA